MADWKIRSVRESDLLHLGDFTQLIYGDMWKRAGDAAYYHWKFFSNGLPAPNTRVADVGGKIVGFQSSCHRRFRLGSEVGWSTELSDSMTHPDYRRQGMWTGLTCRVIDSAIQKGFMPVTGFPNKYSYPGYIKKLSMFHYQNLWRLVLLLKMPSTKTMGFLPEIPGHKTSIILTFIRRIWKYNAAKGKSDIRIIKKFYVGSWADHLWEKEICWKEAGVVKDRAYLKWRFEENPDTYLYYLAENEKGDALGFLITKIREKPGQGFFGFIADLMIPGRDRNVLHRLLLEAEKDFHKKNVLLVDAWISPVHFYFYGLMAYGFLPLVRLPFIVPKPHARLLDKKGWKCSKKWLITMGDSDNI